MRFAKSVVAAGAAFILSACSTFSNDQAAVDPAADAYSDVKSIEMQTRVARLQTENARLANRVLELQRENERLRGSELAVAVSDDGASELESLNEQTALALREPENLKQPQPVFDNPEAPEMTGADVPVEPAPRLTQPTFASTDAVFENESPAQPSLQPSGLFGVHLASYRKAGEAREGWRKLQRENPDELGLLEPRLNMIEVPEKGMFLRLIGGGLSSRAKAEELCSNLKSKGLYCTVAPFDGERLSLNDTSG